MFAHHTVGDFGLDGPGIKKIQCQNAEEKDMHGGPGLTFIHASRHLFHVLIETIKNATSPGAAIISGCCCVYHKVKSSGYNTIP
jgi:hypothetical protein